jgi:uncharacterized membrane protein
MRCRPATSALNPLLDRMSSSIAPAPWPLPTAQRQIATWRFARHLVHDGVNVVQWRLSRNCSIAPRQLAAVYAALCVVSLFIAGFFFVQGAPFVLAFAGLELLGVGAAFLLFARHAADCETLTLSGASLQVAQAIGSHTRCTEFAARGLMVEPAAGQGSLLAIGPQAQGVQVGRFVRPELRAELARELRAALRQSAL